MNYSIANSDQRKFIAWRDGKTGLPLLRRTYEVSYRNGWINFRMRAMLQSVASTHYGYRGKLLGLIWQIYSWTMSQVSTGLRADAIRGE